MRINPGLVTATILTGGAVCFASHARADDFSGTYIQTLLGTQSTWIVTPCGAGCAHVIDSSGWSADAHLTNGRWIFSTYRPDATVCLNGSRAPGTDLYAVDASGDAGTVVTSNPAPCPTAAGYATPIYFTLMKTA